VIDYKTSRQFSSTQWAGERPDEPQLPLYAIESERIAAIAVVLLNQQGVKFAGVGARDFGVRQIRDATGFDPAAGDSWAALKSAWQHRLTTLAVEFADGDARLDQDRLKDLDGDFALLLRPFDLAEEDRE